MIDINKAELNKLKLEDLIADAVERKDVAAQMKNFIKHICI